MIRWLTILAAVAGVAVALYTVGTARHEPPKIPLEAEPSVNPFQHGVASTGIVESGSRDIQIAAPEAGLATKVFVQVGDVVKAGDPLFQLDPRPLEAEVIKAKAARDAAEAALKRVQALPRTEEIPPLEDQVKSLEADVEDWSDQWEKLTAAQKQVAAADYEVRRRWFALEGARARLADAQAKLALLKAGAWGPDVEVARAQLEMQESNLRSVQMLLERRTVRSPIAGTVLKRNIEPGAFAPADVKSAAMVVGDLTELHVRARVDEEDLPRLKAGSKGVARIRGETSLTAPLTMLRIEPLAQPKTDLSGSTTERVDTRVLDVVFKIDSAAGLPLYPGQLVDVYIEGAQPAAPKP